MTTRDDAKSQHERHFSEVLELDVDTCANRYGTAPCTAAGAAGGECYNTFGTCQDKPHYSRTTREIKFCSRHMAAPAGVFLRPYLVDFNSTPTEISADKGMAIRGQSTVTLLDEPCLDVMDDPYAATRASKAGGTYWGRMIARNYNLVGRTARVRRGYVVAPFDWATFQTELYIITDVAGPDAQGRVKITLADPVKKLDAVKLPATTDGKLSVALPAYANTGVAQAGASLSITLAAKASAVDGEYVGQEVYVYEGSAAGQRRTITAYVGATRVATVSAAWSGAIPDTTSSYEVSALKLTVADGKGAQYADPATSGKPEYVRIGDEVIRYTAKAGDVLSWPDSTYRAQFNTDRADSRVNANVQQCRAWVDIPVSDVIHGLLNDGGLLDAYIDLAQLASEATDWYSGLNITACAVTPETVSALLADLLTDINASVWWDAVAQKVKFKANMPSFSAPDTLTDAEFITASMEVKRASADRITDAAMVFGLRTATADAKNRVNFQNVEQYSDIDAKSANEYGSERPMVRYSRWLSSANINFARAWSARTLSRRRDAPILYAFDLDPKDEVTIGALVGINTSKLQGADGLPVTQIARVTKVEDMGKHQAVSAVSTSFNGRYAFIAPNGQANYGSATAAEKKYAYICNTSTGKMSNGDPAYKII